MVSIDGTFGRGGHSRLRILSQLGEEGRYWRSTIRRRSLLRRPINDPRFSIIHGPFSALADYGRARHWQD
ncbi:hypothetical protein KCP75_25215 [Salmonella enterica subsp. enterica]|nr:hypothetical protein KCP75_25215 [Salmonella enterica subsp. enterica]